MVVSRRDWKRYQSQSDDYITGDFGMSKRLAACAVARFPASGPRQRQGNPAHKPPQDAGRARRRAGYCLTSSTRRFFSRPASASLEATGAYDATPFALRRFGSTL